MVILLVILIVALILNLLLEIANYKLMVRDRALRSRELRAQRYLADELNRFNNLVEDQKEERRRWA